MLKNGANEAVAAYVDELLRDPAQPPAPPAGAPAPAPAPAPALGVAAPASGGEPRRRRASDRLDRWIGFQVAGQGFGVEVLAVLEVQRLGEITPAPGASPELMGAINLRGQIVPVLDLGRRLGFPPAAPTPASRLIVVDHQGQPVGLCVDGVSEVITANVSSIEPAPRLGGRVDQGWLRGVLRHKGESVLLLDPVRLLATD